MNPKILRATRGAIIAVAVAAVVLVLGFAAWLLIGKTAHQPATDSPAPLSVQIGPLEVPTWTETLTVATGSMTGYADTRSIVLVNANARHTPEAFEPGDVVSYYLRPDDETSRITHRIVEVLPQGSEDCGLTDELLFRTKGDANEHPDPYCIRAAQITGQVTAVLPPAFSIVFSWARQYTLPIAAAALLVVAGAFLVSGIRDARAARRARAAAPVEGDPDTD